MLLIVLILWLYQRPRHFVKYIVAAALCYGTAKFFEEFDLATYRVLNDVLSGHSLKHLFASGAGVALLMMLYRRRETLLDGGDGA